MNRALLQFDGEVIIEVVNTSELGPESILGSVKVPIEQIMEEKASRKWLALVDHDWKRNSKGASVHVSFDVELLPSSGLQSNIKGGGNSLIANGTISKRIQELEKLRDDLNDYKQQQTIIRELAPPLAQPKSNLHPDQHSGLGDQYSSSGFGAPFTLEKSGKASAFSELNQKEAERGHSEDHGNFDFVEFEEGISKKSNETERKLSIKKEIRIFYASILFWMFLSFLTCFDRSVFFDLGVSGYWSLRIFSEDIVTDKRVTGVQGLVLVIGLIAYDIIAFVAGMAISVSQISMKITKKNEKGTGAFLTIDEIWSLPSVTGLLFGLMLFAKVTSY